MIRLSLCWSLRLYEVVGFVAWYNCRWFLLVTVGFTEQRATKVGIESASVDLAYFGCSCSDGVMLEVEGITLVECVTSEERVLCVLL